MKRHRTGVVAVAAGAILAAAAFSAIAIANTGTSTTTILAPRSTLSDSVQVNENRIKFQTKDPTDLVTQQVTFAPGAYSGWHHHPGVILVLVKTGTVTVWDEDCRKTAYNAGQAFIEGGPEPMQVSNEGSATAVDVATQVAPAGGPFRIEDAPPACAG
ncbi:MAG TPA: cupin domain-containing protein [Gaiellaceae bacterium]|nr:cupin domain-containing protein [Gaiellaceae bacterium]